MKYIIVFLSTLFVTQVWATPKDNQLFRDLVSSEMSLCSFAADEAYSDSIAMHIECLHASMDQMVLGEKRVQSAALRGNPYCENLLDDGDGWGFENGVSCIYKNSSADTYAKNYQKRIPQLRRLKRSCKQKGKARRELRCLVRGLQAL